jgi:3-hydroxybutyrate dehydrogenase
MASDAPATRAAGPAQEPAAEARARLTGRVALVTGGGSGIGAAIAAALTDDGARVAVADVAPDAAEAVASRLDGAIARRADVADAAECRDVVRSVLDETGRLDILVNNAGLQFVSPLVDFPEDRWEYLIRVMLVGPFHLTKAVLPGMLERRWGRIVNIGSVHSMVASPNKSAYIAAKHGLLGLTRATAVEAARSGVTVNLVAPAYTRTALVEGQIAGQAEALGIPVEDVVERVMLEPMPLGRLIEPSEVAAYVTFLCSDDAAGITGTAQVIDGGWTAR